MAFDGAIPESRRGRGAEGARASRRPSRTTSLGGVAVREGRARRGGGDAPADGARSSRSRSRGTAGPGSSGAGAPWSSSSTSREGLAGLGAIPGGCSPRSNFCLRGCERGGVEGLVLRLKLHDGGGRGGCGTWIDPPKKSPITITIIIAPNQHPSGFTLCVNSDELSQLQLSAAGALGRGRARGRGAR